MSQLTVLWNACEQHLQLRGRAMLEQSSAELLG